MPILYLVRHGQAGKVEGNYDELSSLGSLQAKALGEYFNQRELSFSAGYSGTLERQRVTRNVILKTLTDPPTSATESRALNEIPFQELMQAYCVANADSELVQNLTHAAKDDRLKHYFRVLRAALHQWHLGALAGEFSSWNEFQEGIISWSESICSKWADEGNVLAVSSGGTIGTLIAHLLRAPPETMVELNFQLRNSAYCELAFNAERMRLISFNAIDHIIPSQRAKLLTSI